MGFNSGFKGLKLYVYTQYLELLHVSIYLDQDR